MERPQQQCVPELGTEHSQSKWARTLRALRTLLTMDGSCCSARSKLLSKVSSASTPGPALAMLPLLTRGPAFLFLRELTACPCLLHSSPASPPAWPPMGLPSLPDHGTWEVLWGLVVTSNVCGLLPQQLYLFEGKNFYSVLCHLLDWFCFLHGTVP